MGGWVKLLFEGLHNLYSIPNNTMTRMKVRWVRHLARLREIENAWELVNVSDNKQIDKRSCARDVFYLISNSVGPSGLLRTKNKKSYYPVLLSPSVSPIFQRTRQSLYHVT